MGVCFGSRFGSSSGAAGFNAVGYVVIQIFVVAVFVIVIVFVVAIAVAGGFTREVICCFLQKCLHQDRLGALLKVLLADDGERLRRWRHIVGILVIGYLFGIGKQNQFNG